MTAYDDDPGLTWLFHPTHPDDELAFAGWIRHLVQQGATVHMAWTHHTPVRRAEAVAAATRLGVSSKRLHFLDGTDGCCCEELARLLPLFEETMAMVRPDRVVCGAFEQGHLDHDATAWLVRRTFGGPVFEAPFYHTYVRPRWQRIGRFSEPSREEVRCLPESERRLKIELARAYPSQSIRRIVTAYELSHRAVGRPPNLYKWERLREMRVEDWRRPAHPASLAARVARSPRWRRWLATMEAAP